MTRRDNAGSELDDRLAALILKAATLFHTDPQRARRAFVEARSVARKLGDRDEAIAALMGAAHLDRSVGNRVGARRLYRRIAREAPDYIPVFRTLALVEAELAYDFLQTGRRQDALRLYASAADNHGYAAELLEKAKSSDAAKERGFESWVRARMKRIRELRHIE